MVASNRGWKHRDMTLTTNNPNTRFTGTRRRDPSKELYDRACDVRAAAAELRAAARRPNTDAAIASTLRCLESALEQAALATDLLRDGSVQRIRSAWPVLGDDASTTAERLSDDFDATGDAIRAAGQACGELRAGVGPLLAELTAL